MMIGAIFLEKTTPGGEWHIQQLVKFPVDTRDQESLTIALFCQGGGLVIERT